MQARCGETICKSFGCCTCLKLETFRNPHACNSSQEPLRTVMCRVQRSQRTNWTANHSCGRLLHIRRLQKRRDHRSLLAAGRARASTNVAQLRSVRKRSRGFVIRTSGRWWSPRIFKRILQVEIV